MALDGIKFRGTTLRVRRPNNYAPPPGTKDEPIPFIPGVISTNVPDGPNKMFIGGLPPTMDEDAIIEMLTAFGPLRSFNLVKDVRTNISKGYAFYEYADPSITDLAI